MNEEIGKSQVEIGYDPEEGSFYLEAGSEEAFYSFMALLLQTPEAVIAYVETHIITVEEVDMETRADSATRGQHFERVEVIHMMTNLINSSGVTEINNRNDAEALAIIIVNGLAGEREALARRIAEQHGNPPLLECPECKAPFFWSPIASETRTCEACGYTGAPETFSSTGDGGEVGELKPLNAENLSDYEK